MPPRLRLICHERWQIKNPRQALANDDGKTRQTEKANAGIYRKKILIFAFCHLLFTEVLKKRRKSKKRACMCPYAHTRARGKLRYACSARKGLSILERFSRCVRPSLSRHALAFLFCAFAFVSLNFTICPRSPMKLQGVACAKPCYRIGELALTALRMELITIEHT